jgi:uncharacterized protein YpuA (DUF1002 family)
MSDDNTQPETALARIKREALSHFAGDAKKGQEILTRAAANLAREFDENVVAQVQSIVGELQNAHHLLEACRSNIAWLEKKLEAVHRGAFVVDRATGHIRFHDQELNWK